MKLLFNRNPLYLGNYIDLPDQNIIKNTQALWQASYEIAFKFGGDITRECLTKVELKNNRKNLVVDTKIHMLMPGMYPGIPNWHTDGVPRFPGGNPVSNGVPDIFSQEGKESHIFHSLVTGTSNTKFMLNQLELEVPKEPTNKLYSYINNEIEEWPRPKFDTLYVRDCQFTTFDWWDLHTATPAEESGWRFFIRITETDMWEPQTDLNKIIRTQQQVYVPYNYSW